MLIKPVTRTLFASVLLLSMAGCGGGDESEAGGYDDAGGGALIDTAATPAGGMTGGMPGGADTTMGGVPTGTTGADTMSGGGAR